MSLRNTLKVKLMSCANCTVIILCFIIYCAPVASADRRHLRSTNCQLLAVPRYRLNTYGRRAFSVAGPHSLELSSEFHPGPDHQFGLFQTAA